MTLRKPDIIAFGIAGLTTALIAFTLLVLYILIAPCQDITPVFDSDQVKAEESREVWAGVQKVYSEPADEPGRRARPVRVTSIHGRWASIDLVGSRDAMIDPAYGRVWQEVYAAHHGGGPRTCVRIHYTWPSGSVNEDCCLPHI